MKKFFFYLIFNTVFLLTLSLRAQAGSSVDIYYNNACSDCVSYIDELKPVLSNYYLEPILKDYINRPEYRKELNEENKKYQVPIGLQDSLTIFLKPNLAIEGHVRVSTVESLLASYENLPKHKLIILYQPEMHSNAKEVTVFVSGYKQEKVSADLDLVKLIQDKTLKTEISAPSSNLFIPIITGAIANSLHPCAIAVLLLLLTFLYAIHKKKKEIIDVGLAYVFGIFVVYFLIGLGIMKALSLSDEPFFVAKVASLILIVLGIINIKDYFFPDLPVHLKIPDFTKGAIQYFLEKTSIPTAFIVGALVGICAFPCTGGIYTVIISTLAAVRSSQFIAYLMLYNFIFILPLLLIIMIAGNRKLLERVEELEIRNSKRLHLIIGIFMVLIGLGVYLWIKAIIYG
ncbi:hypothetical protein A2716_01190 [candidate division WWE3 bacterium RIFCSPHIGHO2_01_FULL_40_23]|uniref:Cytochrome C biogenesis protein transmembrane domain-containing protein n=1 Tax=candidate division WWE3 bacterium RIFCSPLOWO2_01_FULL_41_18 TaxID=1802625 RepID=A0A1F4VDN1_UNCKA|nr:MAG: hypothetical protein A2716_01190 [candidate division WWE3 bacterium RIFCSPHIGHO2_01_FULL_40_23]OGC55351.1 MAG: hypothetical protein A3A78_00095 [candidate division WWE3 bacterium RIFCSPLOWO2_01_FULL_41_18]